MPEISLQENVYNQRISRDRRHFKIWSSVGLMLTYWCPSRCACCYVFSGPNSGSEQTEMTVDMALGCWRSVRQMAGERGKVHITGGEPFGNYDRLRKILQGASREKLGGLEKIETNAYWCDSQDLVRNRLAQLKQFGLTKLQISSDIYHQEYVPIDRVRMAVKAGQEILGDQGVQIRWREYLESPIMVSGLSSEQRSKAFAGELAKRPERLLGRGVEELANLFPSRDYDSFAEVNCSKTLLGAQHVHIDGAGNVFSGTCIGIILGKIEVGSGGGLEELWRNFDQDEHPIYSILVRKGPAGLLGLADPLGYEPRNGYGSKCHLCYDIRRFLYEKGEFRRYLGPGVCYGQYRQENGLKGHK